MEIELNFEQLVERANEKILLGHELIEHLESCKQIAGVQKVQRKINQEIKFLEKVIKSESLKLNHVQCSNLTHYDLLVKILQLQRDVIHIDCGFAMEERNNPLRVDIVCENGLKWIKAIARNSKSLTDAAKGATSYGARSILDQAQEFVNATEQHLCMFKRPKVCAIEIIIRLSFTLVKRSKPNCLKNCKRGSCVITAEMTDQQLRLWQRNSIFECECDNFINRRIEAGRERQALAIEQNAIDSAIQQHGLEVCAGRREDRDDDSIYRPPAAQRPRLVSATAEQEHRYIMDSFYHEAIGFAIRDRGLRFRSNF